MMKKYKLLKDLPFAKAGEIFKEMLDGDEKVLAPEKWVNFRHEIFVEELDSLDNWFEEIDDFEYKDFFAIGVNGVYEVNFDAFSFDEQTKAEFRKIVEQHKLIGSYSETREEAEKRFAWLKAQQVIKNDANGFEPDWNDEDQIKFSGCYDYEDEEFRVIEEAIVAESTIYFETDKDIKESFEKHEKEWKIYLGVE